MNATKISGRSDGGMGIGFFNAITDNTYATIENASGGTRKFLTEPLTNYNVVVFDQQINNASNIYFINTDVMRSKRYDDANVSGTGYTFANKKNSYATDGSLALSQQLSKVDGEKETFTDQLGYKYFFGVRKISGRFQGGISSRAGVSDTYNPLDLGYYITPNREQNIIILIISSLSPTNYFAEGNMELNANTIRIFINKERTDFQINYNVFGNLLNYNAIFGGGGLNPLGVA